MVGDEAILWASLVLLAIVKAMLVGWFFMHLSHDTPTIGNGVLISMLIPFFYAAVLIAEALWRLDWTQL